MTDIYNDVVLKCAETIQAYCEERACEQCQFYKPEESLNAPCVFHLGETPDEWRLEDIK